ncbi:SemiSWEET transporter [Nanoarchaeota archaeon]
MDYVSILGYVAGALTTFSFVPQLIKIRKTKSTKDISLKMYIVLCIGLFLWLTYGVLVKAYPIVFANSLAFSLALIILILKIRHS